MKGYEIFYVSRLCLSVRSIAHNGFGLGEVAFVRWLVCRKAILPNPCYGK